MARTILPVALLPLDQFGVSVAQGLIAEIRNIEPDLVNHGWFEALEVWTQDTATGARTRIERMLALSQRPGAGDYVGASPILAKCLLVAVGSLSQGAADLVRFKRLLGELGRGGLRQGVILVPVFEVACFEGDPVLDRVALLTQMATACAEAGIRSEALLVDRRGTTGFLATTRAELAQAVQLYLEAFVLGDHWPDYANGWYERREGPAGMDFGSFSIFQLRSPTAELVTYLKHVGYHELVGHLDGGPELPPPPRPTPEALSYQPEAVDNPPALEAWRPTQLLLRPKSRVRSGLTAIRERFDTAFAIWHGKLVKLLPLGQRALAQASPQALRGYQTHCVESWRAALGSERPLRQGHMLLQALPVTRASGDASLPESLPVWEPLPQPHDALTPIFDRMKGDIARLPNTPSLAIHIMIAIILQATVTARLLLLWPDRPAYAWALFVGWVTLYVLGMGWLAWRMPSWRICRALSRSGRKAAREMAQALQNAHDRLRTALSAHWTRKMNLGVERAWERASRRFRLCRDYMLDTAKTDALLYPATFDAGSLAAAGSNFVDVLDATADLAALYDQLHRRAPDFAPELLGRGRLADLVLAGDAIGAERELRACVAAYYDALTPPSAPAEVEHMRSTIAWWGDGRRNALLSVPAAASAGGWSEYYVLHSDWAEQLERACGGAMPSTTYALRARDRCYLVGTRYGLSINDLAPTLKEE
jgi:hypothetical protein